MKKSANDSLRGVFIQWMYTHTHTHTSYTHTEIFLEGEKLIKRFKLQQKVKKKPQKVLIIASFEGDDEKA